MGIDVTGTSRERYDKTIRRKEKLAEHCLKLSQITFASTVLTNSVGFIVNGMVIENLIVFIMGVFITVFFTWLGNRILIF